MIISRTPFRISFTGGGTDIKTFYRHEAGVVLNATINKYMYITINKKFDDALRISYSRTELPERVKDIKHPIVRIALQRLGIRGGVEITSMADIPGRGSGLGSSSSFTVGLLNALYAFQGRHRSAKQLAEEACLIERGILNEPGGKQDQYIASYGGICFMQFKSDGSVFVDPLICTRKTRERLEKNLMMFYTGITRNGHTIMKKQTQNMGKKNEILRKMKALTIDLKNALVDNDLSSFGRILDENWRLKSSLSKGISNRFIDDAYEKARDAGASGGKLMGAGGGGFLLFYVPPGKQKAVRKALGLREIDFSFEPQGSKIIYVSD
ncbi:MAG: hypothetical protein GXP63_01975 [DPANN group archaeon]|nr:hypothetical protein [DPANN group archaeon]